MRSADSRADPLHSTAWSARRAAGEDVERLHRLADLIRAKNRAAPAGVTPLETLIENLVDADELRHRHVLLAREFVREVGSLRV